MGRLRRIVDVLAERTTEGTRVPELGPLSGSTRDDAATTIGVLVYRGVSSSEVDEPVHRLAERLHADVVFVGAVLGPVHAVEPSRAIAVGCTPETAPPIDVLVVPGGLGWKQVIDDDAIRTWLRRAAADARGILAMSTGSLLLASVGRLEGREATGHWLAEGELAALGATVMSDADRVGRRRARGHRVGRTGCDPGGRRARRPGPLGRVDALSEGCRPEGERRVARETCRTTSPASPGRAAPTSSRRRGGRNGFGRRQCRQMWPTASTMTLVVVLAKMHTVPFAESSAISSLATGWSVPKLRLEYSGMSPQGYTLR